MMGIKRYLNRLVERPPLLYRMLFPETVWRLHFKPRTVYLTFDDGPKSPPGCSTRSTTTV